MKKKELTLQDILNEMGSMYSSLYNQMSAIKENLAKISNCSKMEHADTEKHSGPDLPNPEYVTLTEDGCFVGGKSATQYNGVDIHRPYLCVALFKEARDIIREEYGYELLEIRVLQSSTDGGFAQPGRPVQDKSGTYSWCRCVWKTGNGNLVGSPSWVFYYDFGSASNCASYCAFYCAHYVQYNSDFRRALFGLPGAI